MLDQINNQLIAFAHTIPVELFAIIGSFLEEVIAPIPSPLVATLVGSVALANEYGYLGLIWLGLLATIGKTLGCLVLYVVADRAGNIFIHRFGKWLGVSEEDVEKVHGYFTGSTRDYVVLTALRAIPFAPSLPISVMAGIVKIPLKLYIIASLIGNFIRSMLFIALGYAGVGAYMHLLEGVGSAETIAQIIIVLGVVALVGYAYWHRLVRKKQDQIAD